MPTPPTPEQRAATRIRPVEHSPVMFQRWRHLLFLHWQWDPAAIQATLPPGLFVDTFDGRAYIGVVPFWMDAIRPRFCPPIPGRMSWFLELNVRTYVHTADGTPGVWFYSLDCNNPVAVALARRFFHLPYVHARQTGIRPPEVCHLISDKPPQASAYAEFTSHRRSAKRAAQAQNRFRYAGTSTPTPAEPGSLEHFLVERYLLFSRSPRTGRLHVGQVWHTPYPISPARIDRAETTLFMDNHLQSPERPADHALISPGVNVSIYGLQPLPAS